MRPKREILKDHAETPRLRREIEKIVSIEQDFSFMGLDDARYHGEKGRFARTARSEQG
jgi:hypothetical protein